MIEIKSIYKNYENKYVKTEVLKDLNFKIDDKSIVAITGASGSGKTTLLNIMCGLDVPTSGSIIYDGVDITKLSKRKLAKFRLNNCGFVFQDFCLVSTLSVRENVKIAALGKDKKVDEKWYEEVIELLGLNDRVDYFPHQLSGGEKQRVAIARAIMTKPKVIFADEPTGNLDSENTIRIMNYLERYARENECIFVYVTHERDLCSIADIIINVSDKCVHIQGEL
ncbi:MAG: ABC transporter ATP-binding protein [Lachnospiraceae bacterium]|nr:ABC transporter ATP-binding protein [Lachnospiraceae bacterium]